jgi:hypothetical protein
MDFIDEQNIPFLEVSHDCCQITRSRENRTTRNAKPYSHLGCHNARK